jgi:hypothetical protein
MQKFIRGQQAVVLDINGHIEAAADDRTRGVMIRRLRRAMEGSGRTRRARMHIRTSASSGGQALPIDGFLFQLPRKGRVQHRPAPWEESA